MVLNGGFEDGPDPGNSFINVESGATTIPNWTVTDGQVDLVGAPFYQPADGSISLDLNGFITGEVQQTIDTTVGERYLLTFDLAANPRGTPAVKMGQVEVAGVTADLSYDISGQSAGSLDYVPTSLEFIATDAQTVLKFKSLIPGTAGLSIDNVSVVEIDPSSGFHTVEIGQDGNVVENINFGNTQLEIGPTELGINLLVNPDAESSSGSGNFNQVLTPFGWETSGSAFTAVQYSAAVPGQDLDTADGTVVNGDTNYFAGGPSNPLSTATQVIEFDGIEEQIDDGLLTANLSGFFGGWVRQEDNMVVEATFYDENQTILESFEIGSISAADRGGESKLLFQEDSLLVPVGARSAEVEMVATRQQGSYNDGYADNLSFVLSLNDGVQPVNRVEGTDGRDTLTGTTGNDIIIGKGGSDRLTGNAGADQFVFQSIDDRIDRINDFEVGSDKIVLGDLFDSLGVSIDSYDQAIDQGYLGITSFGQDNSRIRIDTNGIDGNGGARTLAIAYDVTPTELGTADNFVI
nr:choice-of-anchor C family protein [Adonisia turfae]